MLSKEYIKSFFIQTLLLQQCSDSSFLADKYSCLRLLKIIYFHLAPKFSKYNEKPNPTIFFSIHCCIENMNATQFELGVKPA